MKKTFILIMPWKVMTKRKVNMLGPWLLLLLLLQCYAIYCYFYCSHHSTSTSTSPPPPSPFFFSTYRSHLTLSWERERVVMEVELGKNVFTSVSIIKAQLIPYKAVFFSLSLSFPGFFGGVCGLSLRLHFHLVLVYLAFNMKGMLYICAILFWNPNVHFILCQSCFLLSSICRSITDPCTVITFPLPKCLICSARAHWFSNYGIKGDSYIYAYQKSGVVPEFFKIIWLEK